MGEQIRVLIAEDSPTVCHYLTTIIDATSDMVVIGIARNGLEAIQKVHELRPDVVSMDISMPEVNGLEATRRIMEQHPTPIVVVSGLIGGDVQLSLQAIESGALAVVSKPPSQKHPSFVDEQDKLLKTLRAMAGVKVISRRKPRHPQADLPSASFWMPQKAQAPEVIVIGASTGGPSALRHLLRDLTTMTQVPIVIVQHMPDEFITGLAQWLTSATKQPVFVAGHQIALQHGMIMLAPGNAHLTLRRFNNRLVTHLEQTAKLSRYRPSIDVLFKSVADTLGNRAIGVILTGMGDDGAAGLYAMRMAGATTLVQDEDSSTVFGMPRAAIEHQAAVHIVSLSNLASQIKKLL